MRPKGNALTVQGVELPRDAESDRILGVEADPIRQYEVDYAEAVRLVKVSTGRNFFINAHQFAPLKVQTNGKSNLTGGYYMASNVKTTKADALHYLDSAYSVRSRAEVNVRISICSRCMFIG